MEASSYGARTVILGGQTAVARDEQKCGIRGLREEGWPAPLDAEIRDRILKTTDALNESCFCVLGSERKNNPILLGTSLARGAAEPEPTCANASK